MKPPLTFRIAPGVNPLALMVQEEDLTADQMLFVVTDWRTEPREHLWVRDVQIVPIQPCVVCGEPAIMKVMMDGPEAPAHEFYCHRGADSPLHMVPTDRFVKQLMGDPW